MPDPYATTILSDSPVGYWRLGEPSGTNAADTSTSNLPGTYINTPTLNQATLTKTTDPAVLLTAGSSQRVNIPDNNLFDLADVWTLEAWIKTTATTGGIVSKGSGAYYMRVEGDGTLGALRSFTLNLAQSSVVVNDGNPHHCVATKNGATTKIYVDGADVTVPLGNSTCADNSTALCIGADRAGAGEFITGTIDEVAVYATALSAARVSAHYTAGLQPTELAPTATAAASAPLPTIKVQVDPPAATAAASAPTPTVTIALTVAPPVATAAASAPLPALQLRVPPPVATAAASAPLPTVTASSANQTVNVPVATAAASAPIPFVAAQVSLNKVMAGLVALPAYSGAAVPALGLKAQPAAGNTGLVTVGGTGKVDL